MLDPNEIDWSRPARIWLTETFITLLSPCDEELCCDQWQLHRDQRGRAYARRQIAAYGTRRSIYLHRAVMFRISPPPSPAHVVDHINGNGLDNRRENLRWSTPSDNNRNKSRWTYFSELAFQRQWGGLPGYENS